MQLHDSKNLVIKAYLSIYLFFLIIILCDKGHKMIKHNIWTYKEKKVEDNRHSRVFPTDKFTSHSSWMVFGQFPRTSITSRSLRWCVQSAQPVQKLQLLLDGTSTPWPERLLCLLAQSAE